MLYNLLRKAVAVSAWGVVALLVALLGMLISSVVSNTLEPRIDRQEITTTVGELVDMRSVYIEHTAIPLVESLVEAILYIREIDVDLKEYGVVMTDNSYLFVEIEGQTYKIGLDIVR